MTATEDAAWAPAACTLPNAERPMRLAEFDDLFATALRGARRLSATRLRWELAPEAERTARELTARESRCCSFFRFTFHPEGATLLLDVEVPTAYGEILDAVERRAAQRMPS